MPPTLIMIGSATSPENARRERKFYEELALALDGFMVMQVPSPQPTFAGLPLDEQIAAVLPDAKKNEAMAVVWMSFPLSKQVMVHLVALGSGRAFVRTIETDRSPASESSLALITRELLGTAYLFESPAAVPAEISKVVEGVKQQISAVEAPRPHSPTVLAPPPAAPAENPWELWAQGSMDYPLAGGVDAVPLIRVGAWVGRRLPAGLNAGLGAHLAVAEVARVGVNAAHFLLAGLDATLFRGFSVAGISVGPQLLAGLDWGSFSTSGDQPTVGFLLPTFGVGAQARTNTPFGLGLSVLATYAPVAAQLRVGDATPLFRTPTWAITLALSFGWTDF